MFKYLPLSLTSAEGNSVFGKLDENTVFSIVLVILVALLGILIILVAVRMSSTPKSSGEKGKAAAKRVPVRPAEKKPEEKKPEEKKPGLMGSLAAEDRRRTYGDGPAVPPGEPRRGRETTSIDKGYAAQHGMWVCGYCEVLNDNSLTVCQACGQPRNR